MKTDEGKVRNEQTKFEPVLLIVLNSKNELNTDCEKLTEKYSASVEFPAKRVTKSENQRNFTH